MPVFEDMREAGTQQKYTDWTNYLRMFMISLSMANGNFDEKMEMLAEFEKSLTDEERWLCMVEKRQPTLSIPLQMQEQSVETPGWETPHHKAQWSTSRPSQLQGQPGESASWEEPREKKSSASYRKLAQAQEQSAGSAGWDELHGAQAQDPTGIAARLKLKKGQQELERWIQL